ncbi:hypothetical protein TD95_005415 [Thielaviopsis punctulata]|uniref:Reverse transcriptase domain-containing protein n=1 Tax=Thielaviopsis punctulata TaxID=72032 RepID=A0A0F4Z7R1_9PEZI|nr:hypothetical protein TD95_005415 [Thielaviopsis punctulata]
METAEGPVTDREGIADVLCDRFFPVAVPLQPPPAFTRPSVPEWNIDCNVSSEQIAEALRDTGPWKAAGIDGIPSGFLRDAGPEVHACIAKLARASLHHQHWPTVWKESRVVPIPKPGKSAREKRKAGAWRPISLLSTTGKIIEKVVAQRLAEALDPYLPGGQMGNRPGRSTEVAVRAVQEFAQRCGSKRQALLLQLDIAGAFDRVDHEWLIHELSMKGAPFYVTNWLTSYLAGRHAALSLNSEDTGLRPVRSGVPQGSPLSPILFITFIASMHEQIESGIPGVTGIEFADDTNLLICAKNRAQAEESVQFGYKLLAEWAKMRGVVFEPAKSTLLALNVHTSNQWKSHPLSLDGHEVKVQDSSRFLGMQLHRSGTGKLQGDAVLAAVKNRAQLLQNLGRKSEVGYETLRVLWKTGLRPTLTYVPAALAHAGITQVQMDKLEAAQSMALRVYTGAQKSTPLPRLRVEAACEPLQEYLVHRAARSEARVVESPAWKSVLTQIVRATDTSPDESFPRTEHQRKVNVLSVDGFAMETGEEDAEGVDIGAQWVFDEASDGS